MDPITLYPPLGGQPITTTDPSEATRLQAYGYTDEPLFDPAEHKVEEVREHLTEHPEDTPRVVAAEKASGKSRKSIVGDVPDVGQNDTNVTGDSDA